ncbi:MAG: hypothetical protein ACRDGG_04355, partial [Anaerolineae bacterium]
AIIHCVEPDPSLWWLCPTLKPPFLRPFGCPFDFAQGKAQGRLRSGQASAALPAPGTALGARCE